MKQNFISSKNFALLIVLFLTLLIGFMLKDFFISIFLAVIFAYVLNPLYEKLVQKTNRRSLSAILILLIVFVVFLIPSILIGSSIYSQFQSFELNLDQIESVETSIENLVGIEFSIADSLDDLEQTILSNVRDYSQQLISLTTSFFIGLFLFAFILYYSLIEKKKIVRFVKEILPFSTSKSTNLINQSGFIVKALLIGQVLTAIIQGTFGMVSFMIAGINGAIFWGIIMIILSLIPMVGAFLVWFPAGILLLLQGEIGMGIFILAWGALVVSQIDNIVRPILVTRYYNIHPLFVILGVFAGLSVFGILGIIIGPLLFELFILVYTMYREEYITHKV